MASRALAIDQVDAWLDESVLDAPRVIVSLSVLAIGLWLVLAAYRLGRTYRPRAKHGAAVVASR